MSTEPATPFSLDGLLITDKNGNSIAAAFTRATGINVARFIVLACNCHDDLLAACKAHVAEWASIGRPPGLKVDGPNSLKLARAAIAKAEPTSDPARSEWMERGGA